ncbi:MAG: hypothetical protein P1V97_17305 [Planctomycetota bacterium]|nr:hypothetical protein [Planctomycetota bacterium]
MFKRFLMFVMALSLAGCPDPLPISAKSGAKATAKPIIQDLYGADKSKREAAKKTLASQGSAGAQTLLEVMKDKDWNWHQAAKPKDSRRLQNILTYLKEGKQSAVSEPTTDALIAIGAPAIPSLMEALEYHDYCRQAACFVLSKLEAKVVSDALREKLRSKNAPSKAAALVAIGILGKRCAPALPAIYELFNSEDLSFRKAAATAIVQIRRDVYSKVAAILEEVGKNRKIRGPILEEKLKSCSPELIDIAASLYVLLMGRKSKQEALIAIRALGVKAAPLIPRVLIHALGPPHSDIYVQALAQSTLQRLPQETILKECINSLRFGSKTLKHAAARQLALTRGGVDAAIPDLIKTLPGANPQTANLCLSAIAKCGEKAKAFIPQLILANTNRRSFSGAFVGLLLKVDQENALKHIFDGLNHSNAMVRQRSAECLKFYPDKNAALVDKLIVMLDDKNPIVVRECVHALGECGSAGKKALPKIRVLAGEDRKAQKYYEAAVAAAERLKYAQ